MIGDHYTDEVNKDSIPVIVCRLEYHCKRRGKRYSDISVPLRGYFSEIAIMNDAIARQEKEDPYYPQDVKLLQSHLCEDGGFGVAEYIGVCPVNTKANKNEE